MGFENQQNTEKNYSSFSQPNKTYIKERENQIPVRLED